MVKFTLEDKINAIELYLLGKESYESIGQSLKTDGITIMEWVKRYEYQGIAAFDFFGLLKSELLYLTRKPVKLNRLCINSDVTTIFRYSENCRRSYLIRKKTRLR